MPEQVDLQSPFLPLQGFRILSLALNLPGPAALQRCQQLGAVCRKLEPPAGDPMRLYSPVAYDEMHTGLTSVLTVDLKTAEGQAVLHSELAHADVLLTAFRPSVLPRLGLDWPLLQALHPLLSHVAIVGHHGAAAEKAGHDVIYMAENGLINDLDLPLTLFADMAGVLQVVQALLCVALAQGQRVNAALNKTANANFPTGQHFEVALSSAARFLAQPLHWGLTAPGAVIGGGHAGYRVYRCQDGRVVLAALEPHFAGRLCAVAGLAIDPLASNGHMMALLQSPVCTIKPWSRRNWPLTWSPGIGRQHGASWTDTPSPP